MSMKRKKKMFNKSCIWYNLCIHFWSKHTIKWHIMEMHIYCILSWHHPGKCDTASADRCVFYNYACDEESENNDWITLNRVCVADVYVCWCEEYKCAHFRLLWHFTWIKTIIFPWLMFNKVQFQLFKYTVAETWHKKKRVSVWLYIICNISHMAIKITISPYFFRAIACASLS